MSGMAFVVLKKRESGSVCLSSLSIAQTPVRWTRNFVISSSALVALVRWGLTHTELQQRFLRSDPSMTVLFACASDPLAQAAR